jgi:hypothetical protein
LEAHREGVPEPTIGPRGARTPLTYHERRIYWLFSGVAPGRKPDCIIALEQVT